jgi:hypothetical protein
MRFAAQSPSASRATAGRHECEMTGSRPCRQVQWSACINAFVHFRVIAFLHFCLSIFMLYCVSASLFYRISAFSHLYSVAFLRFHFIAFLH